MEYIKENLEKGIPVRNLSFSDEQQNIVRQLFMLTSKPMIYAANISEDDVPEDSYHPMVEKVVEYAKRKYSCTRYMRKTGSGNRPTEQR